MSNAKEKEYVKTLTISDLFNDENKCKYIIASRYKKCL